MLVTKPVGIYLSVPFCKAKCSFCNFASDAFAPARMDGYVEQLCREIRGVRDRTRSLGTSLEAEADSIYFGGGTPSLLGAEHFRQIFAVLRETFDFASDTEATIECAPGQLADATLEELLRQGMNRISLGVQSFVDREAAAVGRLHTGDECEHEIARLAKVGVSKICLDLIAGLPHQTEFTWIESIKRTIGSGVDHVSIYMLEIDEDSRLGREVIGGGARYSARDVPSEDDAAAWYEQGMAMLADAGIAQYEVSNFATPGHESRHNMKYWQRKPYVGFGLDAHSMLEMEVSEAVAVRFQNADDLDAYMNGGKMLPVLRETTNSPKPELIDRRSAFEESLFLGLRMNVGVCVDELRANFGDELVDGLMAAVHDVCEAGLLEEDGVRLRLTLRGRMASNEVFSRLLVPAIAE